ncbi:MAG: AbiEi antitoxin N-terminal domain-containing protein [Paracoccaceae bacterium]|nr:AbiEi antitoxin N-terminal domain-containing protein [Paracoccaceae bacterium]MDE2912107.1 AbiEi antitoxin N-terminal domain-containing protein [Paracoccaceae bacterium]
MLNSLHLLLPEGLVADAAWFARMGYPCSLCSRYLASGWLLPVTGEVFRRPLHKPGLEETAPPLRLQHFVVSLQMVMERPIAVGGRSALELHGFAH